MFCLIPPRDRGDFFVWRSFSLRRVGQLPGEDILFGKILGITLPNKKGMTDPDRVGTRRP